MEPVKRVNRRDFLRWSTLAASASALAGCAPQVIEKVVKETVQVEVQQTVEVEKQATVIQDWPKVRWVMQPSQDEYADIMEVLNAWMEEKHIRVVFEPVPGDEPALIQRMLAGFAAGDAPDVFVLWGPYLRMCIDKGIVLPFNPFLEKDSFTFDDYVQGQIDASTKDGQIYGMPMYCGIWATWYNKDLFEEAGLPVPDKDSWDLNSYLEAGQKIVKRDANGNLLVAGTELNNSLEFGLSTAIWSYGGEVSDPTRTVCKLSEPKAMEALQMVADMIWEYKLTPSAAETTALATSGGWGIFPSGKSGLRDDGTWYFCCGNVDAFGDKFRYGILPHWKGPDGKRMTFCTTDQYLCNGQTKYPDACWEFLKFCGGKDMARIRMNHEHFQPAIKSMAPEWIQVTKEYAVSVNPKNEDLDLSSCVEAYEYAQPMFWWNCHTAVMEILNPVIEQIYTTGKGAVKDLIPEVCEKISQVTC